MIKAVYFDTNIFDHIHKGIGVTEADLLALRSAVKAGRISILLSVFNLEEILLALESPFGRAIVEAELRLVLDLVDYQRLVKPPEQLLSDDIRCYAQDDVLLEPFITLDPIVQSKLQGWANPSQQDIDELQPVIQTIWQQKKDFKVAMMEARKEVLPYVKKPLPSFADYFGSEASYFAERLAEHDGVLNECQERGIDGLLRIRSVSLAVGANLSLVYSYTVGKRIPDHRDSRDLKHAVSASAAEIFVTHDRRLAEVLTRVPIEDFRVMDLHGLLEEIC